MANPHRGEIIVTLAGVKYILRLGNDEICEIETGLQLPMSQWGQGGMRLVREVLYVGIHQPRGQRRMSRKKISRLLDNSNLKHVSDQMGNAIEAAMPPDMDADDDDDDEGKKGGADSAAPFGVVKTAAEIAG